MNLHLRWRRNPDGRQSVECRAAPGYVGARLRNRGVPRAPGLRPHRHHLPPTRLLGPHRSVATFDRGCTGQRHATSCTPTPTSSSSRSSSNCSTPASHSNGHVAPWNVYATGLGGDLASSNLVLVGTNSVLAHTDGEVVDLLKGGQGVLNIVPLSGVLEELDAAILEIEHKGARAVAPGRTGGAHRQPFGRLGADRGSPRGGPAVDEGCLRP